MKVAPAYKYRASVYIPDIYDSKPHVEAVNGVDGNLAMMKRFLRFSDALQFCRLLSKGFENAEYSVDLMNETGDVRVRLVQTRICA